MSAKGNVWRWPAALVAISVAVVLVAMPSVMVADDDNDDDGFNLGTLKGDWGFSGDGWLVTDAPPGIPIAGVGIISFDGEGGCVVTGTTHLFGVVFDANSVACIYTVDPDGTGTATAEFPPLPGIASNVISTAFVIVDDARELRMMQTSLIVSGFEAKRIR